MGEPVKLRVDSGEVPANLLLESIQGVLAAFLASESRRERRSDGAANGGDGRGIDHA